MNKINIQNLFGRIFQYFKIFLSVLIQSSCIKQLMGKFFKHLDKFSKKFFRLCMRLRTNKAILEMLHPNSTNNSSTSNTQTRMQTTQEQ